MLADRSGASRSCSGERRPDLLIGAAAIGVILGRAAVRRVRARDRRRSSRRPLRSAQAALTPALARDPRGADGGERRRPRGRELRGLRRTRPRRTAARGDEHGRGLRGDRALVAVSVRLRPPHPASPRERRPRARCEASTIVSEAFAGFRAIGRDPSLRVMMGLFTAETAIAGALQVYIVVLALETLDLGDGGVGFLNSAMGVGALIGAVLALSLAGVQRLSPAFLVGLVLCAGCRSIVVGLADRSRSPVLFCCFFGLGGAFVDVPGVHDRSALGPGRRPRPGVRSDPDALAELDRDRRALAPVLVDWLGLDAALVASGAFLPALSCSSASARPDRRRGRAADRSGELRILASIPIFTPLPGMSLEHLAGRLVPLRREPGTVIVREGESGDRFYIVAEGEVEVSRVRAGTPALTRGGYFGEIALIRDVPTDRHRDRADRRRPLRARPRRLPRRGHEPRAERRGSGDRGERATVRPGRDGYRSARPRAADGAARLASGTATPVASARDAAPSHRVVAAAMRPA